MTVNRCLWKDKVGQFERWGLGDIIYKHGWLVRKGKGHIHLYQPNSAGFGTLIKERMGSQPTDRGGKAGHAAGHDRECATLAYTSPLP
jgi:hypothetical protein